MPLLNCNDPAVWAAMYSPPYTAANRREHSGEGDWVGKNLRLALGLQPGQRVLLVGSGYGWTAEEWEAAYPQNPIIVGCVDTSTIIQSGAGANAKPGRTIANFDINAQSVAQARNSIRNLFGNNLPDWIITEDVLPCWTDAECTAFGTKARQYVAVGRVAHMVTPTSPSALQNLPAANWKTLAQWKAFMTPDVIVGRGSDTAA